MGREGFVPRSPFGPEAFVIGKEKREGRNSGSARHPEIVSLDAEAIERARQKKAALRDKQSIADLYEGDLVENLSTESFLVPLTHKPKDKARKELKRLASFEKEREEYRRLEEERNNLWIIVKELKEDSADYQRKKDEISRRLSEIEGLIGYGSKLHKWAEFKGGELISPKVERQFTKVSSRETLNRLSLKEKKSERNIKSADELVETQLAQLDDHELVGLKGRVKAKMNKIGSTKKQGMTANGEEVLKNVGDHLGMKHGLYTKEDAGERANRGHERDYKGPAYAKHKQGASSGRRDSIREIGDDFVAALPSHNEDQYSGSGLLPESNLLHFRDQIINSEDSEKIGENFDKLRKALKENPEQNELVRKIAETINKFTTDRSQELWELGIEDLVDTNNPEKAKASFFRFLVSEGGITSVYHPDFYRNKKISKFDLDLVIADAVLKFPENIFASIPGAENLARDLANRLDKARRDYLYTEEKAA